MTGSPFRFVLFGDSICVGQGVAIHETWAARLSRTLAEAAAPRAIVVSNPSVNGSTTRQALERMAFDVQNNGVDAILIQFGLNDGNHWETDRGVPRVSPAAFAANLGEMIDRARAFGAGAVMLNTNHPTTRDSEIMRHTDKTYESCNRCYNEIIREVAAARDVMLNDVEAHVRARIADRAALGALLLADGLHLSRAGHDIYFEFLAPRVAGVVGGAPGGPDSSQMNILILHNAEDLRSARRSILDYIFSFERYQPRHNYFYHRIVDPPGEEIRRAHWDAVILESTALGICTFRPRELFHATKDQWSFLKDERIVKIVFPQDDANHGGLMDDWFVEWGVQYVFSVRPAFKAVLYPKSSLTADFQFCLAGYIDDNSLQQIQTFAKPWSKRRRLIGQRVTMYPARGGRQGRLKGVIAEKVKAEGERRRLAVDISTDPKDVLYGDAWFEFLGDCKFVLGTEGGLSLHDPYGEIFDRINEYVAVHPDAGFEQIEAACFPGLDGKYVFPGFSPRILEAAMCGASQVLVEGGYMGLLEPGVHYLSLKADCSNLDEVFDAMGDAKAAKARIAACERTLVGNPAFRYSALAARVIAAIEERRDADSGGPVPSRSALHKASVLSLIVRERAVGFKGVALAESVAEKAAARATQGLAASGSASADLPGIIRHAAWMRTSAALFAELSREAGRSSGEVHALAAAAASANLAADLADTLSQGHLDAAASHDELAVLEQTQQEMSRLLQNAEEDAAGALSRRLGMALQQGGRRAEVLASLAGDAPDSLWAVLDQLAPPSTQGGSWAVDDHTRLAHVLAYLRAAPPGSDLGRLVQAFAAAAPQMVGPVGRLAPASGERFSEAEIARLQQLDGLLVRAAAEPGGDLAYLDAVQQAGRPARLLLEALRAGGDLSRLIQALVAAGARAIGPISRLAPLSGDQYSEAEIACLHQLDTLLVRAASEPGADLAYLGAVQQAGGDLGRLIRALVAAGAPAIGPISRLAPRVADQYSEDEIVRLGRLDTLLARAAAGPGADLDFLDAVQQRGVAAGAEWQHFQILLAEAAPRIARLFANTTDAPDTITPAEIERLFAKALDLLSSDRATEGDRSQIVAFIVETLRGASHDGLAPPTNANVELFRRLVEVGKQKSIRGALLRALVDRR